MPTNYTVNEQTAEARYAQLGGGGRIVQTAVRSFQIEADDDAGTEAGAIAAAGVPAYGEAHPRFAGLRVIGRECAPTYGKDEDAIPRVWTATIQYSDDSDAPTTISPTARPTRIHCQTANHQIALTHDANGEPILNTAGMRFQNLTPKEDNRVVLVLEKNFATMPVAAAQTFRNVVNSDTFYGIAAGKCLCRAITWTQFEENGTQYYAGQMLVEINDDGWKRKEFSNGFDEKLGGQIFRILDADRNPSTEPVLLAVDGQATIRDGVPTGLDPYQQEWDIYPAVAFAGAGF
jgi:hypothetical protein